MSITAARAMRQTAWGRPAALAQRVPQAPQDHKALRVYQVRLGCKARRVRADPRAPPVRKARRVRAVQRARSAPRAPPAHVAPPARRARPAPPAQSASPAPPARLVQPAPLAPLARQARPAPRAPRARSAQPAPRARPARSDPRARPDRAAPSASRTARGIPARAGRCPVPLANTRSLGHVYRSRYLEVQIRPRSWQVCPPTRTAPLRPTDSPSPPPSDGAAHSRPRSSVSSSRPRCAATSIDALREVVNGDCIEHRNHRRSCAGRVTSHQSVTTNARWMVSPYGSDDAGVATPLACGTDADRVVGGRASVRAPLDCREAGQVDCLLHQVAVWTGDAGASQHRGSRDQRGPELRIDPRVLAGPGISPAVRGNPAMGYRAGRKCGPAGKARPDAAVESLTTASRGRRPGRTSRGRSA